MFSAFTSEELDMLDERCLADVGMARVGGLLGGCYVKQADGRPDDRHRLEAAARHRRDGEWLFAWVLLVRS